MSNSNITTAHANMPQGSVDFQAHLVAPQGRAGNHAAAFGNPVLTIIQPTNPNVIPNPSIQQIQTINKAIKMLSNHQLLMKFATENQQSIPAARLYWEKIATAQLS